MRYPNGKAFSPNVAGTSQTTRPISHGKRGMWLEHLLNEANQWYRTQHRAVIYKKPTPVQVVAVDYPKRSQARIKEAYYRQPSTTDYNGVYRGRYIDFEAKQTKQKTRFPLKNFHDHQIAHMNACAEQGGICFAIILFSTEARAFLYPLAALNADWTAYQRDHEAASIPIRRLETAGYAIPVNHTPYFDYLTALDQWQNDLIHSDSDNQQKE